MKNTKIFKLKKEEILPIAKGYGGCMATDKITIEGNRVGFMYREKPMNDIDSGWRFFSGYEDDEYINDASHTSIFEVNTIANYDPDIIPFLDAPIMSVFERNINTGMFEAVLDFEIPD